MRSNIIILSGGGSVRLWPLSNNVNAKQLLKVFRNGTQSESMLERMYKGICDSFPDSSVTIATTDEQKDQTINQLGKNVNICVEPCCKDTFAAILLACAKLVAEGHGEDEIVIVCPSDSLVEAEYFTALTEMESCLTNGSYNIVLMGITPTFPSSKYGYFFVDNGKVISFTEKPDCETAQEYINNGALWNAGVFGFKLSYLLEITQKTLGYNDYETLHKNYSDLEKISFDYAVVEEEHNIGYVNYSGHWDDLGTWDSFTKVIEQKNDANNKIVACQNTIVINELETPIITMGINNAVVVATPDGILVSDRKLTQQLKDYVIPKRPMHVQRIWGEYTILDISQNKDGQLSLTKRLTIDEGQHISYQIHQYRTENWTILDGEGLFILDGVQTRISRGAAVSIKAGMKHGLKAITKLTMIEVQMGSILDESDIQRFDLDWDYIR